MTKLNSRCTFLEQANEALKLDYEAEVNESESLKKHVAELKVNFQKLFEQKKELEAEFEVKVHKKVKAVNDEKRNLQLKHEKVCAEIKCLKRENEDLKKDFNQLKVALKSSKKETKDLAYKSEKKLEELEAKTKDLLEYKIKKLAEEKDIKSQIKKVDKKLKNLSEREAKLELEANKLDKTRNIINNDKTDIKKEDETEPKLKADGDLDVTEIKNETENPEIKTLTQDILEFFHSEPTDDIDVTIAKLEMIKDMFEQKVDDTSDFDEMIATAKNTGNITKNTEELLEQIEKYKIVDDDDEHLESEYFDDTLPKHYYGEDGCELMFEDSNENFH